MMKKTSKPIVGKILDSNEEYTRDAIHVPVLPLCAGDTLGPGDHICLDTDKLAYPFDIRFFDKKDIVGIVDPFLDRNVLSGEKFYCFIKPNTIKSLWHEWTLKGLDD